MDKIYLSGAVQNEPEVPDDVEPGYPTNGSSGGGVPATVPGAHWYDGVTCEITNAIEAGGIKLDRHNKAQLAASIRAQDRAVYDSIIPLINQLKTQVAKVEIVPTGMIAFFASSRAPNSNWLVCDGRAVSRTAYASLFAAIGGTYGWGNGSTTFNLPYLIERTVWGGTGGIGSARQAGLPDINGAVQAAINSYGYTAGEANGAFWYAGARSSEFRHRHEGAENWAALIGFAASRSNSIYGRSNTVQPPALVLLPCIHI